MQQHACGEVFQPTCSKGTDEVVPTAKAGAADLMRSAAWQSTVLAPVLAVLSCILFCFNGQLLQALQMQTPADERHASPMLNLLLCHVGGLVFLPSYGSCTFEPHAKATGLVSGTPSAGVLGRIASRPRFAASLFAILLMGYNYCWLLSTRYVTISVTNATFQTSVGFVYAASVPLFGEPLKSSRILGVVCVVTGSMLASGMIGSPLASASTGGAMLTTESSLKSAAGVVLALGAAIGVALYQVLFRLCFGHLKHDARFLAFFSAWVGVWHVLVLLPLVVLASAAGLEQLELPSGFLSVTGTLISAALASAVNILYLCIALWGTPMLLPCASGLSVPVTVVLDGVLHGSVPGAPEALGHVVVMLSVVLILNLHGHTAPAPCSAASKLTVV